MKTKLLLFSLFWLLCSHALRAQWVQTNGPYGGYIQALVTNGSNLYAGINGGVFLSTNNGGSWAAVNTGLTNTFVLSLAVSGSNLYAGTNGGGVFLSTNNGGSWAAVNTGLTNTNVLSLAVSGSNLYAGTNGGGVFLSTNNGDSWAAVNTGLTNTDVRSLAVSGSNLYAGTYGGGVWSRPLSELVVPPTITSFSPTSGAVGTTVTLTGTNFSTTPANNTVKFNGVTATVTASTATSITATVPTGATSGNISVTIAGNTGTSANFFGVDVKACGVPFLDPGGNGNYGNNQTYTQTFAPVTATDKIKVSFSSFSLESCCDFLKVYNGPSAASPLLISLAGTTLPVDITSTATGGELTFVFTSDGSVTASGWEATISCSAPPACIPLSSFASSDFSTDIDGWALQGDAQGSSATPVYASTGGNPAGYIQATDDATGGTWYWVAPAKYLTNLTRARLTFDMKETAITSYFADRDIVVTGGGLTLHADLFTQANLSTSWQGYSFDFNETTTWYKGTYAARTLATLSEIRTVLQNPTQIAIRGEFNNGADTGSLDNVLLATPAKPLAVNKAGTPNTAIALSATGATGSLQYRWYSAAAGGSSLSSTSSYTTPNLNSTTTYYVSLIDPATSCESERVPVIATIYFPPTITSFSPTSGTAGTSITITGTNLTQVVGTNTATVNGVAANVTGSTANSITLTVPTGATTGKISVTVNGQSITSTTDFTVITLAGQWAEKNNGLYGGYIPALAASGDNLIASSSGNKMYLSTDNGASWAPTGIGLNINALLTVGNYVYAAGEGIYRSADNGATWTQVSSPAINYYYINALAAGNNTVFAGGFSSNGPIVLRSTDNGTTWTRSVVVQNSSNYYTTVLSLAVSGTTVYAGIDTNGQQVSPLYRSSDNGSTWQAVSTNIGQYERVRALAVSGSYLYAGTNYNGVYVSANNGATWTQVNSGLGNLNVGAFVVDGGTIYAGTDGGVFTQPLGGSSWQLVGSGLIDVNSLAKGQGGLFAGTYHNGVYRLSAGNWAATNTGLTAATVNAFATVGGKLWAATYGGLYSSADNGATWAANPGSPPFPYTLVVNGSTLFVGSSQVGRGVFGGGVYRSTDNGASWTQASNGLPTYTNNGQNSYYEVRSMAVSGSSLVASGSRGVYRSDDNGNNWIQASSGLPTYNDGQNYSITSIAASGSNLFAAAYTGSGYAVYRSTNNGSNWTLTSTGLPSTNDYLNNLIVIGGSIFVGTGNGVYRSNDNGNSWAAVNLVGLPSNSSFQSLVASGNNLFASAHGGVYQSTNSGANWTAISAGLPSYYNTYNSQNYYFTPQTLTVSGSNLFCGLLWPRCVV